MKVTLGPYNGVGGSPHPAEFHCAPGLEMLGGLGCRFVNAQGENILPGKGKEPAASGNAVVQNRRSTLGHAILRETKAGRNVFLDCTHFTPEQHRLVKQVVPILIHTFERAGYNLSKDVVPYSSALTALE